jgi:hypothetical protein
LAVTAPKGTAAILLGVGAITAGEAGRPLAANLAVTTTVAHGRRTRRGDLPRPTEL